MQVAAALPASTAVHPERDLGTRRVPVPPNRKGGAVAPPLNVSRMNVYFLSGSSFLLQFSTPFGAIFASSLFGKSARIFSSCVLQAAHFSGRKCEVFLVVFLLGLLGDGHVFLGLGVVAIHQAFKLAHLTAERTDLFAQGAQV